MVLTARYLMGWAHVVWLCDGRLYVQGATTHAALCVATIQSVSDSVVETHATLPDIALPKEEAEEENHNVMC